MESHLKAARRSLGYLTRTLNLVLHYPAGDNFVFVWYADANYVGYLVDQDGVL